MERRGRRACAGKKARGRGREEEEGEEGASSLFSLCAPWPEDEEDRWGRWVGGCMGRVGSAPFLSSSCPHYTVHAQQVGMEGFLAFPCGVCG